MNTLPELLKNILAKLAEFLGLRKSEEAQLEQKKAKCLALRRTFTDELENLKMEIRSLEQRARSLKTELEQTKVERRRIVIEQIELTKEELDGLQGRQDILVSRISHLNTAIQKIDELIAAMKRGVGQDVLDEIAIGLEDTLIDLKDEGKAAKELKNIRHKRERIQRAETIEPPETAVAEEPPKEELSEESAKWLKELE